jgi:hypothetical protein
MNSKVIRKMDASKRVTLPVSAQGMTIRVAPGSFSIGKTNHILPEEAVYTVKPNRELQWIGFYLMQKKDGGQIVVVTDEVYGNEQPLEMTKDPEYNYLWHVASLKVPAGAKTLDGASLTTFTSEAPPDRNIGRRDNPLYPKKEQ